MSFADATLSKYAANFTWISTTSPTKSSLFNLNSANYTVVVSGVSSNYSVVGICGTNYLNQFYCFDYNKPTVPIATNLQASLPLFWSDCLPIKMGVDFISVHIDSLGLYYLSNGTKYNVLFFANLTNVSSSINSTVVKSMNLSSNTTNTLTVSLFYYVAFPIRFCFIQTIL